MKNYKGVIIGIVIVALGVIWGLNRTGLTDINIFFDGWWTLFIIVPSVVALVKNKNRKASSITLAIGILLLIGENYDLSPLKKLILPVIVVAVGAYIIIKAVTSGRMNPDEFISTAVDPNYREYYTSFASQRYVFNNEFLGAKFGAMCADVKIDLRNSYIRHGTVIELSSTFSSIDVAVPADTRVIVKSGGLFGSTSDRSNKNLPFDAKTLYVNSKCVFGGVTIRYI